MPGRQRHWQLTLRLGDSERQLKLVACCVLAAPGPGALSYCGLYVARHEEVRARAAALSQSAPQPLESEGPLAAHAPCSLQVKWAPTPRVVHRNTVASADRPRRQVTESFRLAVTEHCRHSNRPDCQRGGSAGLCGKLRAPGPCCATGPVVDANTGQNSHVMVSSSAHRAQR